MSYLKSLNNIKEFTPKAKVFKVLGNERRLAIIDFLAKNETNKIGWTVSDISLKMKIPYKSVSQHLQLLENMDLVDRLRVGKEVEYMTSDLDKECLKLLKPFKL
jgi:DNA-binding transcriptional ArsR family regulator